MPLAKFVPYEMKTILIKVTSYEGKNIKGYLVNSFFEKEMCFDNLTQLLLLMDHLQNALGYPQESMESRSFTGKDGKEKVEAPTKEAVHPKSTIASFKVNILFRQNASWQGNVVWVEKQTETPFRSALELIMLLDSVLEEAA